MDNRLKIKNAVYSCSVMRRVIGILFILTMLSMFFEVTSHLMSVSNESATSEERYLRAILGFILLISYLIVAYVIVKVSDFVDRCISGEYRSSEVELYKENGSIYLKYFEHSILNGNVKHEVIKSAIVRGITYYTDSDLIELNCTGSKVFIDKNEVLEPAKDYSFDLKMEFEDATKVFNDLCSFTEVAGVLKINEYNYLRNRRRFDSNAY